VITNAARVAKLFLESLQSEQVKDAFEHLSRLVTQLENKKDPDPIELKLLESIYLFLEKLQLLQGNLKSYSRDFIKDITKNKLSDLYDKDSGDKISLNE
jgi:hypothetical protein